MEVLSMKRTAILLFALLFSTFAMSGCKKEQGAIDSETERQSQTQYQDMIELGDFTIKQCGEGAEEHGLQPTDYYIVKYNGTDETPILPTKTEDGSPIAAIGKWAFANSENLKNVTIPDSYTAINSNAFYGFQSLLSVTLGSGISYISEWEVFSYCNNLTEFIVSNQNPHYYVDGNCLIDRRTNSVIYGCKNSVIPEGIERIGTCAFCEIETLEQINIPQSVTEIGADAFFGATNLIEIYLHKNIITIGFGAFLKCPKLTIYCEVQKKPEKWDNSWIDSEGERYIPATVYWGCNAEDFPVT